MPLFISQFRSNFSIIQHLPEIDNKKTHPPRKGGGAFLDNGTLLESGVADDISEYRDVDSVQHSCCPPFFFVGYVKDNMLIGRHH